MAKSESEAEMDWAAANKEEGYRKSKSGIGLVLYPLLVAGHLYAFHETIYPLVKRYSWSDSILGAACLGLPLIEMIAIPIVKDIMQNRNNKNLEEKIK